MGADDGAWTPPAGFGVPGINVEAWIRDTLTGLFASMESNSAAAKLAKPLKIAVATSARGRLEITAVMQPAAFDKVVEAVESDESMIDRWAEQIGKLIAAELAAEMREALAAEDDESTDYDDVDDDD
jgi:nucleotide-binding universal stress UspA family protein